MTKYFNCSSGIKRRTNPESSVIGEELESCDVSSLFVNGTSFEDMKEIASNLKSTQIKATGDNQKKLINISDFNVNKFMTNRSESSNNKQQTESNYISNGANPGMPSGIKNALRMHGIHS